MQTGDRGMRSKGQISLNSITKSISKIFIPTYLAEFSFGCLAHAPGGFKGAGWSKTWAFGICDGAPSTAYSSLLLY